MAAILIFGLGYTATALAERLAADGWHVAATRRTAADGVIGFDDEDAVRAAIASATHILSSVPPDEAGRDAVLDRYGAELAGAPARWIGYLSSTGVYGDAGGAWVDEAAPTAGRRPARTLADAGWQALRGDVRVFRLPGIYGPGRSALERMAEGRAHRIALPDQVFSRVHVADIVGAIVASFDRGPAGAYNIADDHPCHQNRVTEEACRLLGRDLPPLQTMDEAGLGPMARAFYAENRRVANGKAKRLLGWAPRFAEYRAGLADCYRALALNATTSPAIASAAPAAAVSDQR